MQVNTITEEEHKDLIESLRNNDCLILNAPLTHLEDGAIESFKSIANTLKNHCVNNRPVQYEFTPNENMLSWLSYYDKSQIIGIEVSPEHGLPILYILQIYDGWHKQHKSIVQSQFLEYASQCTSISINGSIFNPINCVDAFCDWYIRSNIGSLNFGLTLDINEDNIYCLTIKIKYNFIQRVHTPQVLENHLGEFFNEKAQNYLFPISAPPAPKEIEQGIVKKEYSAIVIMAVAQIVDSIKIDGVEVERFLPRDETDFDKKVELTIIAISNNLGLTVGPGIRNHFNCLNKLTKPQKEKVVKLLNSLGYTPQARDFRLNNIANNR